MSKSATRLIDTHFYRQGDAFFQAIELPAPWGHQPGWLLRCVEPAREVYTVMTPGVFAGYALMPTGGWVQIVPLSPGAPVVDYPPCPGFDPAQLEYLGEELIDPSMDATFRAIMSSMNL